MNKIDQKFEELKRASRSALMPYLTLGYPTPALSVDLICAAADAGADLLELGIPFSDPLADGPTIQHAAQVALKNEMTVVKCLELVRAARERGVDIPFMLMSYFNPILRFGVERFAREASPAGADGLIIPDLPPEEASELKEACEENGLDLIFLAAPTSRDERIRKIAEATNGFLYLVSLTGVTGARDSLPPDLEAFVRRVRVVTGKSLAVGFGVSTPESASRVGEIADGVIVGSALVSRIGDPATAVEFAHEFVSELRLAVDDRHKAVAGKALAG